MTPDPSLAPAVRVKLSAMMFLQFFVWGAWFVTMGTYLGQGLGFDGVQVAAAYSTMPWGTIVAPFFVGMIADRFFAAERVLGVMHLLGAGLLLLASRVTTPAEFFWVLLAYAFCYSPTLALVNAVAFTQMASPEKQFPSVRLWGTIGWIVAGLIVGTAGVEATATPLRLASLASLVSASTPSRCRTRRPRPWGERSPCGMCSGSMRSRFSETARSPSSSRARC
jgi:hypothetical protein